MADVAALRLRVLRRLTVIDMVEAPQADQMETCDQYISDSRAELLELGLCWWAADAIPDSVLPALTNYVASKAAGAFGKQGQGLDGPAVEMFAEKQLRRLKNTAARPDIPGVYF